MMTLGQLASLLSNSLQQFSSSNKYNVNNTNKLNAKYNHILGNGLKKDSNIECHPLTSLTLNQPDYS